MNYSFEDMLSQRLRVDFYEQTPEIVAKELLGKVLVYKKSDDVIAGIIVETEAYLHSGDESSHSFKGLNSRNEAMFMRGGTFYVYLIYGVHHCVNIVTQKQGYGSAVLIRAVEPIAGIEVMIANRRNNNIPELCKGPGNLAKSFGFDLSNNKNSLLSDDLFVCDLNLYTDSAIAIGKRIGITKSAELPLRFYLDGNLYVSMISK